MALRMTTETTPGAKLKTKAYTVNFRRSQSSQTSSCKYFTFYFPLYKRKYDEIKRNYVKQNTKFRNKKARLLLTRSYIRHGPVWLLNCSAP